MAELACMQKTASSGIMEEAEELSAKGTGSKHSCYQKLHVCQLWDDEYVLRHGRWHREDGSYDETS
jgi:hypothetical protein